MEELDADYKRKDNADAPPILRRGMLDSAELGVATATPIEMLKPAVRELLRM